MAGASIAGAAEEEDEEVVRKREGTSWIGEKPSANGQGLVMITSDGGGGWSWQRGGSQQL